MLEKLLGKNWVQILWLIGGILAAAIVGLVVIAGPRGFAAGLAITGLLGGLVAAYLIFQWLAILVHEVGHVLAACLTGMKVYTVSVGKKIIYSRPPHLTTTKPFGGYVIALNPKARIWHLAIFMLGGPLVSLLMTGAIFYLYLYRWRDGQGGLWSPEVTTANHLLNVCLFLFGITNLGYFLSFFTKAPDHDLMQLVQIVKQPREFLASHRSYANVVALSGLRPRDYQEESLHSLRDLDGAEHLYHLYDFWKAFDLGDMARAEESICAAFRWVSEKSRTDYYAANAAYEMSMFAARFMSDQKLSRDALTYGERIEKGQPSRGLAIAARLNARGKIDCAIKVGSRATQDFVDSQAWNPEMQQYGREWAKRIIPELT